MRLRARESSIRTPSHLLKVTVNDHIESAADAYHIRSRNLSVYKSVYKAYEVHFSPYVLQLAAQAPLQLPSQYERVGLPKVRESSDIKLEDAILRRTSGRNFGNEGLTNKELATLLFLGGGVRDVQMRDNLPFYQRNAPNSGNLGSVEIYPIIFNVTDLPNGIYHFDSVRHDLARIRMGDFRQWLREYALFQIEFSEAACVLVLTAAFGRLRSKYGERGYRLGYLDVGHVSENIYLAAIGLELEVCATAGFIDEEVDAALGLDGLDNASSLVIAVGRRSHTLAR